MSSLTSFFGPRVQPGAPLGGALAAVTGHPDQVEAVGLQALDQMAGGGDVDVLVVDQVLGAVRVRFS